MKNPFIQGETSWSMRTEGQTDRHDEALSRVSQFCARAKNQNLYIPLFLEVISVAPSLQQSAHR